MQMELQSSGLGGLGKGEQRALGRCRGIGPLSSGLDSPWKEQRGPMLMQKEPQSSGLDGQGKEEQRGPGPFRGSGSGQEGERRWLLVTNTDSC